MEKKGCEKIKYTFRLWIFIIIVRLIHIQSYIKLLRMNPRVTFFHHVKTKSNYFTHFQTDNIRKINESKTLMLQSNGADCQCDMGIFRSSGSNIVHTRRYHFTGWPDDALIVQPFTPHCTHEHSSVLHDLCCYVLTEAKPAVSTVWGGIQQSCRSLLRGYILETSGLV